MSQGDDKSPPIWVVWMQYSDRSADPEFIGWTTTEARANAIKELIEAAGPSKSVYCSPVEWVRFNKGSLDGP